jgi:ankyrin repeat protein
MDVVVLLLGAGASIDAIDNRGRTALMIAAELGHGEIVDLLLGRGADRSIVDKSGKRAGDLAANDGIREKIGAR